MEGEDETNNESQSKKSALRPDEEKEGTNSLNSDNTSGAEPDYPEIPVERFKPNVTEDARNWNSGSGVPRGDRNRVLNTKPSDPAEDDNDLFDDEDDVL